VTRMTKYLRRRVLATDLLNHIAVQEAKCERSGGHSEAQADQIHLLEALRWLMRAQDAVLFGGLSRGYSFGWNPFFPRKGWQPAHPKPTAEAINTLFDCAAAMSRIDLRRKAIDLADWLVKIQMYSGAIRGGALDEAPSSEVFNTALAIIGWIRAARETGAERFSGATRRACDFLVGLQHHGMGTKAETFRSSGHPDASANSAVGLALIKSGIFLEEYAYCAAGEGCLTRVLNLQKDNGWFNGSSLDHPNNPLLQTIAASAEDILLCGMILDNPKYIQASKQTADALLNPLNRHQLLSGRFRSDWSNGAPWSCPLGSAKMAVIWSKLYQITGEDRYMESVQGISALLKKVQNRNSSNPGLRGGIKGCFPCDGDFGRYQTISSATLQFINLLLPSSATPWQQIPAEARTIQAGV
jgi:hypothetical protein